MIHYSFKLPLDVRPFPKGSVMRGFNQHKCLFKVYMEVSYLLSESLALVFRLLFCLSHLFGQHRYDIGLQIADHLDHLIHGFTCYLVGYLSSGFFYFTLELRFENFESDSKLFVIYSTVFREFF